ncbi:TadE/TadG family type IV pilus assembly protein [Aureibacillus halotolerans]|uniref:TadE-like protein n=1 Tax=Aureibacillus halotolerans TaxID=1508390 RepID=A0A4R6U6R5_9BACI|nr:TadE/TadG family type IV pilus assembly protein [Aureibacillus halotolerans]TDQ42200.1 TadE-like protein [Aureibacillus halotolerans]
MRRFLKNKEGSISLEASIVMPLFLMFLLFLVGILKIAAAEAALQHAVSEGTKQVATHIYPVQQLAGAASGAISGELGSFEDYYNLSTNEFDVQGMMSDMAQKALSDYIDGFDLRGFIEGAVEGPAQSLVKHYLDEGVMPEEGIKDIKVELPGMNGGADSYLSIEVTYELPLPLPFIDETILLKKKGFERVWTGA